VGNRDHLGFCPFNYFLQFTVMEFRQTLASPRIATFGRIADLSSQIPSM